MESYESSELPPPENLHLLISPPKNLRIISCGEDITLAWDELTEENLAGYRIFCREEGQSYNYYAPVWEGTYTICTIYNLNITMTYYFVVRAFDTSGFETGNSNEVICYTEMNSPPVVEAGPDQTITLPESAILDGTVTDDGLPNPPGIVTTTWSKVSGIGTVAFADANAIDTTASFSEAGTYLLKLTADDGGLIASDDTIITVNPAPDLDPPDPDPMTWDIVPHQTGPYSIFMTATTATDISGAEYYFECIAGGGNNSLWQDSSTYEDTGLQPGTQYVYRVKARDKSPDQNETNWSQEASAITEANSPPADVRILGSWVAGTSHTKEPGYNRALLFIAHAEDNNMDIELSSVSYGGQPMIKIVERNVGTSYRTYVVAYILDETGITAATGNTFTITWVSSPNRIPAYSSVFLENVNQTALLGDMDSNGVTSSNTLSTSALFTNPGDMVIVAGTCGNTGTYSLNNSFTEAIELSMESADGIAGYKLAVGVSETPSITHSDVNRQVIIGFVVQPVKAFAPDLDPPVPDPMTWHILPHQTGPYSISMTATTATDISGAEYYFECIEGGGNNSLWQDSSTYEDTGLQPGTQYVYRVKARDKSPDQNETNWSEEASAIIENLPPAKPVIHSPSVWKTECQLMLSITASSYSDPENDPHSQSRWQISKQAAFSSPVFDITGSENLKELFVPHMMLEPNTTYYVRVQFSDASLAASDWSDPIEFTNDPYKQMWHLFQMWPVQQQMWYFKSPKGIATDHKGYIYIADMANHRIQKFTADGEFVSQWGKEGSGEGEFDNPSGIAIDSRGLVYVADSGNNRIQRFTQDGGYVTQWGIRGSGEGQFREPSGIAIDAEDFVYISDSGNHRIQKFTRDGDFVKKWGSRGTYEGQFWGPAGIAIDTEGFVYIADSGNHRIQVFTQDGIFEAQWEDYGSGDSQFNGPTGIAIDKGGFVFVADLGNNRIQKFTRNGGFVTKWGSYGSGDSQFNGPTGIAIDAGGIVYVADEGNDRIQKFTQDGAFVAAWGSSMGIGNGQFDSPKGITMDGKGFVYVVDSGNNRIQKFNQDGGFVAGWGDYGSGDSQFNGPAGIAIGPEGFLYVADSGNNRIQKFNQDGGFVAEWGNYNSDYDLRGPTGIAINTGGFLYVVDSGNHRIQKFMGDGWLLTQWGGLGTGDGQFDGPAGIAIDAGGFIYVADSNNHRIQKFTQDGGFVEEWGSYGSGDSQFNGPVGIAIDPAGFVYVADYVADSDNYPVKKFTADGEFITQFCSFGSDPGELNRPEFLYIDPNCTVYVADTGNHRIQVFEQVFKRGEEMRLSRAIIVAGGGPYLKTDLWDATRLWDATQMCANFAYRALTYRGFTKETIYYLSSDTLLDLDNNGELDDVDAYADIYNLHHGITQWAIDPNKGHVEDVILYMVDHGGDMTFRMNQNEILRAQDLGAWLDLLQEGITGKLMVIYDACHSGSFLPHLTSGEDRVIITSASKGEEAYFITQGSVSFSQFFWTHIFNAESVGTAFDRAKEAIHYATGNQNPLLEDNGDLYDPNDGALAENTYIGMYAPIFGESPLIDSVSHDQSIHNTNFATLYASGVKDPDGIARVWAVIRPPNYRQVSLSNPVLKLPSLNLEPEDPNDPIDPNIPIEPNTYAGIYDHFTLTGTYYIAIYAKDRTGSTSPPSVTHVNVNTPLKRRAIIVAGGSEDPEVLSPAYIEKNAYFAYRALLVQGYTNEDIYLMTPEGTIYTRDPFAPLFEDTNVIDTNATSRHLEEALTLWAGQNTRDLVIYLIGEGNYDTFRINQGEILYAQDLDLWLDQLQDSNTPVTLIYDASYSGDFISMLIPLPGKQRILISSTSPGELAHFTFEGDISFSALFWPWVINGANLRDAFRCAYDALGITFSNTQIPVLDDTGDGVYTSGEDLLIARTYTIGTGIMLAGDAPLIGSVSPEQILEGEKTVVIWAEDVTTTNRIKRVFAVITPPWYMGVGGDPAIELELFPTGGGRYEAAYEGFSYDGTYNVSIFAMDENRSISIPKKTWVHYYEDNDTRSQATDIVINGASQRHNFHVDADEDWIRFYGIEGVIYYINASHVGARCDLKLELYDTNSTTPLKTVNFGFAGEGEFMSWRCLHDGVYYVMIRNFSLSFGEGTEYTISVDYPGGFINCMIRGIIRDAHWGFPIEDAYIRTSGEYSGIPGSAITSKGTYILFHQREDCTVTASAEGYRSVSEDITYNDFMKKKTIIMDFDLEPDQNNPALFLSPGLNLLGCPFKVPQGYTSSDLITYLWKDEGISTINILRYDPQTETYELTVRGRDGLSSGRGFGMKSGAGYFLYMEMEKEIERRVVPAGGHVLPLTLKEGINIISLPSIPPAYTSYDLLSYLGSPDEISGIRRFDSKKGAFGETYYAFGRPSGNRFPILKAEAYILYMKTTKEVSCPQ